VGKVESAGKNKEIASQSQGQGQKIITLCRPIGNEEHERQYSVAVKLYHNNVNREDDFSLSRPWKFPDVKEWMNVLFKDKAYSST
jgi:hypothetical protein